MRAARVQGFLHQHGRKPRFFGKETSVIAMACSRRPSHCGESTMCWRCTPQTQVAHDIHLQWWVDMWCQVAQVVDPISTHLMADMNSAARTEDRTRTPGKMSATAPFSGLYTSETWSTCTLSRQATTPISRGRVVAWTLWHVMCHV